MAVSIFNNTDLKLLADMKHEDLRKIVAVKTIRELLIFKRNLQISLASYSKMNPAHDKLNYIQGSIIGLCKQIENAARDSFTLLFWRKIKAKYPNMTPTERVSRKHKIKTEWERINKSYSY